MDLMTAKRYRKQIEQAAESLTDEQAVTAPEMFRHWKAGEEMNYLERICYEQRLYKVNQTHTSQEGWEPDKKPALFTEIPRPGEIPVWRQPMGAQDAYMTGDRVHYPTREDPVYISVMDNNVWSPDVFGWNLYD